jgi:hypothetical protein
VIRLIGLAAVSLLAVAPAAAQNDGRIRVIGRATVEAVPDCVAVRIGVPARAALPSVEKAVEDADGAADLLSSHGVRAGTVPVSDRANLL